MPRKNDVPPDETPDDDFDAPADDRGDEEQEPDNLAPAPPADDEPEARPMAAVHAGGFLEYRAHDGTAWRCDRVADLFSDFKITGSEAEKAKRLSEWHQVMCPVPNTWQMLRRWYRVAPLIGSLHPDDMREWSREDLARSMGFSAALFDKQMQEAWDFWHRVQMEKELATRMVETAGVEALDEKKIAELVNRHGFQTVPVQEHPYVALRIMDMSHLFELAEGRMLAQSAIFQELMMRAQQRKIGHAMQGDDKGGELEKLYASLQKLQTSYEATLEKLGATQDQNPNFRQRVAFNDSVGQISKAIMAYYADDDTAMIDGIFTQSEVKLLLTPTTLRPAQYRPDLVLLAQDWKANFWKVDYVAAKLPRQTMQRLTKGFDEGVRAQMVEDGEVPADMEDGEGELLEMAGEAMGAPADGDDPGADVGAAMPDILPLDDAAPTRRGAPAGNEYVAI